MTIFRYSRVIHQSHKRTSRVLGDTELKIVLINVLKYVLISICCHTPQPCSQHLYAREGGGEVYLVAETLNSSEIEGNRQFLNSPQSVFQNESACKVHPFAFTL